MTAPLEHLANFGIWDKKPPYFRTPIHDDLHNIRKKLHALSNGELHQYQGFSALHI